MPNSTLKKSQFQHFRSYLKSFESPKFPIKLQALKIQNISRNLLWKREYFALFLHDPTCKRRIIEFTVHVASSESPSRMEAAVK